ncbi:hypothetical protein GCM10009804_53030 [Kribbella hippodromi]|uniref:DUF2690 domain-containing protein n=2 Tax=Kribbella hippodromi TaxID=434347 RepID=A0ABN2DZE5_9ACTN
MAIITGVFAWGVPSAYAVGCYGETCYNKGPVAMGCTKDQRLISDPAWRGNLQVLYSPACRAAWADSNWEPLHSCWYLELERARSNLIVQSRLRVEHCPGEAREWTNMFPGGWYYRAVRNDTASGGTADYTAWVFR